MEYLKELKERLQSIVGAVREEIAGFRTSRPTIKLIENIKVDCMGTPMELKQVASLTIELPRDIVVSPWDKTMIPAIEKALQESAGGLSIVSQTGIVRAKVPDLTDERKKDMQKIVKATAEEAKIKVRMLRDDINKKVKTLKDEDAQFRTKEAVQKEVDSANREIDSVLDAKLKEME